MLLGEIRIRLLEMPRLVREMIEQAIAAQPDMVVLGDAQADDTAADIVVCGVGAEGGTSEYRSRLTASARVRVVEIGLRDGKASTFALRTSERTLGELGPVEIVAAIRKAAEGRER